MGAWPHDDERAFMAALRDHAGESLRLSGSALDAHMDAIVIEEV